MMDEDVEATGGHAYDALTPDLILSAVESTGRCCDGRLLALNSYENRVYRVGIEDDEPIVAKFYRPERWPREAITEEHRFAAELADLDIPVVAPLEIESGATLSHAGPFQFALFPLRPGRWPELESIDDRISLGRFLGRIHAVGAISAFEHRPIQNVDTHGWGPLERLMNSGCVPREMTANIEQAARVLLEAVEPRFEQLSDRPKIRVHGDFHLGNVLWSAHGASIVDLDDCCTALPLQDLWMLLDGSRDDMQGQMLDVLEGYEEFHEFDYGSVGLIEALRGLRMVRYNGWLAERWSDPAFPRAFPWFDTPQHWEQQLVGLREQLERLDDPPLRLL
ncbi:MAG: serine/threonine protein kinase [Pseudomonadota bacterium]